MWNIKNKLCLITGATSGIGLQTALELSRRGAQVVITFRNEEKAQETERLFKEHKLQHFERYYCDLSSFDSIRSFTNEFKSKHEKLDVLINNAGIWETERKLSVDGIELNIATNHLGPFLLTNLLLDILANPSRIINVSSSAHRTAQIFFDDIELKNNFSGYQAYGQSKLANILFTKQLAIKLMKLGITSNCLHPGVVNTNIFNKMGKIPIAMMRPIMINPIKGSETSVYLATSMGLNETTGRYFDKKKIVISSPASCDLVAAEKLWNLSCKYVGL